MFQFKTGLFYAYCAITFVIYTTMYPVCELIQASMYYNNLEKITQNFALTLTHVAGFMKVTFLEHHISRFWFWISFEWKIVNLTIRGKRFIALMRFIEEMIEEFADNKKKVNIIAKHTQYTPKQKYY